MLGFRKKTLWKVALLLTALLISLASLIYTNYLAERLKESEKKKVRLWVEATKKLNDPDTQSGDLSFLLKVVQQNETVPVILVNENEEITSYRNLDSTKVEDSQYLQNKLAEMKAANEPIVSEDKYGNKSYVYYKDSVLVTQLRYFPYVQLLVIALFFGVAYIAFSASRKYEQNRVWVGLAKETAHQLGTPLSSLMGWVSYLKASEKLDEEITQELEKDINRLQVVTDRFSKIGSVTHLQKVNIYEEIEGTLQYLRSRFSDKVQIKMDENANHNVRAKLNASLFDWVIENLVKNAIDAIEKEGKICFNIEDRDNWVIIDIADTGKGINRSEFKSIFEPGFTTRKRGWGLGLSLSKRIIEHYHKGYIFVKSSEINKGTTFRIKLHK